MRRKNERLLLTICGCAVVGCRLDAPPGGNVNGNESGPPPVGVEIAIPNEGAAHVPAGTQVAYAARPPASGPHWSSRNPPAPVQPGFYDKTLEEEQWVHNLEHGYVVILYDCRSLCDDAFLDDLRQLAASLAPSEIYGYAKVVIAPYDGLPYLLTCVAWDVQLHLDTLDDVSIRDFYERHLDRGPEDAP